MEREIAFHASGGFRLLRRFGMRNTWKTVLVAVSITVGALLISGTAQARDSKHVWTYESDAVGSVPAGCTTPSGRAAETVSADIAHHGSHSLLLADDSTSSLPVLNCARTAVPGADLSFAVDPAAAPNGFMVDLTGTTTTSTASTVVFHMLFRGNGAVQWYDGARWLPLAPAGTLPVGSWSRVEIGTTADQDMAYVHINGRYLGSAGPWGINPITAIDGFQFAGFGTATDGDHVYFDDVSLGDALHSRPAAIVSQYGIGPSTTVATSDTPIQMPTTAARVPLANDRQRILMDYPAHTDVASTAGNQFVYSDDAGRTWHDYQAHNPMPDAPSFMLTRLADGSLFAINYHGYVAPKPNQSVIETAVSTDNGNTWTHRSGLMTGSQDFAPYSCERPTGCTAFVQVHNLIQDRDGTMYQSAYGRYVGDTKLRQVVLISHDGGINWTVLATVAYSTTLYPAGTSWDGFCEGVLTRTSDGGLLIVMRTGGYLPMYTSRSSDNGKTWSAPAQMHSADGQTVSSVYPTLDRLPDGSLLLFVGRPGYALLRSTDDGATWSKPTWLDYQDSANGYLLPLGGMSVMVFGDRGANWQNPARYAVWARTVTVRAH